MDLNRKVVSDFNSLFHHDLLMTFSTRGMLRVACKTSEMHFFSPVKTKRSCDEKDCDLRFYILITEEIFFCSFRYQLKPDFKIVREI